jgi:PE family
MTQCLSGEQTVWNRQVMRRRPYVVCDGAARGVDGGGHPAGIGSSLNSHNAAAEAPTQGGVPAAADEVSALTAAQFAAHAQVYQAVSAQAAAIHELFVKTLGISSGSYAETEAANMAATG